MSKILWSNNARSTLAGAITNVATTATLATGTGVLFPAPGAGEYFDLTFTDALTGLVNEIVHVTNVTGDVITMVRAQEGTTAVAWNAGDFAANLVTAAAMAALMQSAVSNAGRYLGTQVITTNGSITLASGTGSIRVRGCGGGGGSGAVPTTDGTHTAVSAGGGAGAWGDVVVSSGLTSLVSTIGAGGVAGVDGVSSGVGGNGGNTTLVGTFGTITFPGGGGSVEGIGLTTAGLQGAAAGGTVATQSGGTTLVLNKGEASWPGIIFSGTNAESGVGGSTPFGEGGPAAGASAAGQAGTGYGAGGGGAMNLPSNGSARTGAAGTIGVLFIDQFTS